MDEQIWPSEWLRGVLSLSILAVIAAAGHEGTYGYAIAQRLHDEGLGAVKGGTIYPILNRLEQDGYVASNWVGGDGGPGRKAFVLTESGRRHLVAQRTDWQRFAERATTLITTGSK